MTNADDFWAELSEAIGAAEYMIPEDAATMIAARLDRYRGQWPHIKADIERHAVCARWFGLALWYVRSPEVTP